MVAQKMLAPNTTLWWLDQGALTTPKTPKVSEFVAALLSAVPGSMGMNISPAVASGYSLNPSDSDTQTSTSIVDTGSGVSRGAANYAASIPFFREADPTTNATSIYLLANKLFKTKGRMGYLVRRIGKVNTTALAAGDLLEVYLFMSWTSRVVVGGSGGPIQFVVPFLQQGSLNVNVAAVA